MPGEAGRNAPTRLPCNSRLPCVRAPWVRSCCSLLTSGALPGALPVTSSAGIAATWRGIGAGAVSAGTDRGSQVRTLTVTHMAQGSAQASAPVSCLSSERVSDGTEQPTQKGGRFLIVDVFRDDGKDHSEIHS